MKDDIVRRPMTTASNFYVRAICPDSERMERLAEEAAKYKPNPDDEMDDSRRGTLLHAIMAGVEPIEKADSDDRWAINSAKKQTDLWMERIFSKVEGDEKGDLTLPVMVEHEVALTWPKDSTQFAGEYLGTADLVASNGVACLIVDYKFGRNPAEHAQLNLQGRCYVVGKFGDKESLTDIYFALYQPFSDDPESRVQFVHYTRKEHYSDALEQLTEIKRGKETGLNPTIEGCRYCGARLHCQACREMGERMAKQFMEFDVLPPPKRAELLRCGKLVAQLYEENWKPAAKKMLEDDPTAVPGFELRPGYEKLNIINPQKAFDTVWEMLAPLPTEAQAQFLDCVTVKLSALEEKAMSYLKIQNEERKKAGVKTITQESHKETLRQTLQESGAAKLVRTEKVLAERKAKK